MIWLRRRQSAPGDEREMQRKVEEIERRVTRVEAEVRALQRAAERERRDQARRLAC